MSHLPLSAIEAAQLGTQKGAVPYFADAQEWEGFRQDLVAKSKRRNPGFFDPELAAYTPGETRELLNHPEIQAWHQEMATFAIPKGYDGVMLVPCAASKPWRDHANMRKSKLYQAYNRLIDAMEAPGSTLPRLYLVTISEPLGVVPMERWNAFPAYDNPGLFRDDFLRTGMVKTDWEASRYQGKRRLPFDDAAYQECIGRLSQVIGTFLGNVTVPIAAFVDDAGFYSTHAHMLDQVTEAGSVTIARHAKRAEARVDPYDYLEASVRDAFGARAAAPKRKLRA